MNKCFYCKKLVKNKYCNASCQLKYEYQNGIRNPQKITEKAHQTLREKGHYKRDNTYLHERNPGASINARLKNSESKKGENNPMFGKRPWNYQDNGYLKSRYIKRKDWIKIKKLTLIRDGFECQGCGIDELHSKVLYNGQPLQVHHLVPYRVCCEHKLNNLITLCCSCHSKATQIEQRVIKLGQIK